jgi:hypothetical protein
MYFAASSVWLRLSMRPSQTRRMKVPRRNMLSAVCDMRKSGDLLLLISSETMVTPKLATRTVIGAELRSLDAQVRQAAGRTAGIIEAASTTIKTTVRAVPIGVGKSEGRRGARAAWRSGRWAEPYVTLDGWTFDECLDLHADERASVDDWKELGRLYVSRFKPEHVRTATNEQP